MDTRSIIEATRLEDAFGDAEVAERVFWDALDALGPTMQADDRRALEGALPSDVVDRLLAAHHAPERGEAEVVAALASSASLAPGRALEVLQVVAETLAGRLPELLRGRLERHAHPELAPLWTAPSTPEPPPRPVHHPAPGHGHTLASGRPGSRHPLAESGPAGHVDSIALNPDPHGDRKLSSARIVGPERTLAEGRPGSTHPLSEGGDD
jgi:uncharacterized protein (DUF2267 family)